MEAKHWAFVALAAVGGLYIVHLMMNHGGVKSGFSGLGFGR